MRLHPAYADGIEPCDLPPPCQHHHLPQLRPLPLPHAYHSLQDLKFVGMMQYDGDLKLPANYLVSPPAISHVSGEYLLRNGVSTFACSETQKFGHVTFFWNGNRSGYLNEKLEQYVEVSASIFAWFQLSRYHVFHKHVIDRI